MKNFPLSVLTDGLFSYLICFIAAFSVSACFMPRPAAFAAAITLSSVLMIFIVKRLLKKRNTDLTARGEKKAAEDALTALNLSDPSENLSLFKTAYEKKGFTVTADKTALRLGGEKTVVCPVFGFDGLTKTDVVRAANAKRAGENAIIYTAEASAGVKEFAARFNGLTLISGDETYLFLKNAECLPKTKEGTFKTKKRWSVENLLSKKKAKTFFGFGAFFLLSSFFVPYKTYYIVCGVIMAALAVVSLLFGKTKREKSV